MKICLVSNLFPPLVHGGAEIYVGRLAEALANDHEVVIITSEPGLHREPRREVTSEGLVIYRVAPLQVAHLTTLPHRLVSRAAFRAIDFYHPQVAAAVRTIMVRERPDVVHIHNWVGLSLAALLSSVNSGRFDRIPVAMTLHDYGLCCLYADLRHPDGRGCSPRLACRVMAAFNQRLTGDVRLAIGSSQYTLDLHRERGFFHGAEQLALVNGIPAGAKPAARPKKDSFDVLFLGPVHANMGPQLLIRAFRQLSNPDLRLHIAGTGPDLAASRSLAEGDPRIIFHGLISGDALRDLMALADCAVLPSVWPENAPVSIQESFQAGPVIIAPRVGAIPEMIRDGLNGLLVDAGDESAIARSIEKLQQSPELVSRLRAEAYKTARLYDMAFHTAHLTQAYLRLIATNRVSPLTRKAA